MKKKTKAREKELDPVQNAEAETSVLMEPSNYPSNITPPAESSASPSPAPAAPYSPIDATPAASSGPETLSIPLDGMRALAMELAQMREELNQLKMTGHVMQPQQPRDLKTAIVDLIGNIAGAASKFTPPANSEMASRMNDMMWNHFATMDQVFLKMAGINLPPVTHPMVVK